MNRASITRFVVDEDPEVIPGTQVWIDDSGQVWHDLHFVHTSMFSRGVKKEWREWRAGFTTYMKRLDISADRYHLRGQGSSPCASAGQQVDSFACRVWNIADSFAVLASIWHTVEVTHIVTWATAGFDLLTALQTRIAQSVPHLQGICIRGVAEVRFRVREGQLDGWGAWYLGMSKPTQHAWSRLWGRMPECAQFAISADTQRISTIVHFVLYFRKARSDARCKISRKTQEVLNALRCGLLEYLSQGLDLYLKDVYLPLRPQQKPPLARISPKKNKVQEELVPSSTYTSVVQQPRKYVQVDPETMWDMMEDARASGASIAQVTVVRRGDPSAGCGQRVTSDVLTRMNFLYMERMRMAFLGVNHLCIVADPATHSKRETMISICWSWQAGVAAYGAIQYLPQAKNVLASEQEMPEHIAQLCKERRLERVAAFRQLQALSNVIKQTGLWGGIDDFRLGDDYNIDAIEEGEVRVVQTGEVHDHAWRVCPENGTAKRVLPDAALAPAQSNAEKLLVVSLDQGSVGAAGIVFAQESMGAMVFAHWDKYHRLMRDINLAMNGTASGLFLKTRIFSAHLWSLNYKPWGTGLFGTQKKQLLNIFMATQGPSSPIFRKYAPRIAETLDRQLETEEDYTALFDDLPFLARSFTAAMDVAKMGRWFSWNSCARDQLGEFWVQKMILEDHLGVGSPCASAGQRDPDETENPFDDLLAAAKAKTPQAELAQLKAANGGFTLAYKLMTSQLYDHAKVLYTVTKPLWNWYVDQVQNVKSPKQGLMELAALDESKWMQDPQLAALVTNAFHSATSLSYMNVQPGHSPMTSRIVALVWRLVSQRAWSLAARHHGPPQSYVGLLSRSPLRQRRAMNQIERDWKALAQLEQRRLAFEPALRLWKDMQYAKVRPIRLLWALCEASKFDVDSCGPAKCLLRGLLDSWPDNKIVEDAHNHVKADSTKTRSTKRSPARQTDCMVHSGILESRGIPHTSRVTKSFWVSRGGALAPAQGNTRAYTSPSSKQLHCHYPQKHGLPREWATLMGRKVWGTSTEANHRKSLATWQWYQVGRASMTVPGSAPPKLCDAFFTRLLDVDMVVERDGRIFASLGNCMWAALLYPLLVSQSDSEGLRTIRWGGEASAIEFAHVVRPSDWSVLTCRSSLAPAQGIVLEETEQPRSLLVYSLREKSASLSLDTLQQLSRFLELPGGRDREPLLRGIAEVVFDANPDKDDIIKEILQRDTDNRKQSNATSTLLQDPLFEAAWDDMQHDEQLEFPEVRKEKTRGRVLRHYAARKENERASKRRRTRANQRVNQAPAEQGEQALAPAQGNVVGGQADEGEPPLALAPAQGNIMGDADEVVQQQQVYREVPGVPRGLPWGRVIEGRPMFVLARTHAQGVLKAITVTCNLHRHDGMRCNKSLSLGVHFSEEEATRRIKAWCVAGLTLRDEDGSRQLHMDPSFFNPRTVPESELRSIDEMDALVS